MEEIWCFESLVFKELKELRNNQELWTEFLAWALNQCKTVES